MMIIVAFEELLINIMANIGGDVIDSMGRESEVTFIITRRRPGERERERVPRPHRVIMPCVYRTIVNCVNCLEASVSLNGRTQPKQV